MIGLEQCRSVKVQTSFRAAHRGPVAISQSRFHLVTKVRFAATILTVLTGKTILSEHSTMKLWNAV